MTFRGEHAGSQVATKGESFEIVAAVPNSPVRIFLLLENRLLGEAMARIFRKRDDLQIVGSCNKKEYSTQTKLESRSVVVVLDFLDPDWLSLTRGTENTGHAQPRFLLIGMTGE